jgi:two-component system OmpR family response regulator
VPDVILIVEDEDILREAVADYFKNEGFQVLEAANGRQAITVFEEHEIDLAILDIMLPEMDGWSVCRRIRKTSNVPIIILTARSDEEDTLLGFELGTDDYVTKPFSPPILVARAKRLLSRAESHTKPLTLAGIQLLPASREALVDGIDIGLTHTEFEILLSLMEHRGNVLTRDALIMKIWGYDYEGDDRTINTHIRNLRKKLGPKAMHISTVVRNGYKFVIDA